MPRRIGDFRLTLKEKGFDAFLVSNFYNILYLSGFKTLVETEREAWFLVTADKEYLFTDSRYKAEGVRLITPEKRLIKHLEEIIKEEKIKALGFEADDLRVSEYEAFQKELKESKLIPTEKLITRQREIKDDGEIKKIKEACRIIDECLRAIVKTIKIGVGEKEIAQNIEFWLKNKGYGVAFDPIVAIDENSAVPHYNTGSGNNTKIKDRSIILIDAGARFKDYNSDITRMICVGKPGKEIVDAYDKLLAAQSAAIERLGNEKYYKNIDALCRRGFSYGHSTGHGVGLEVHEYPKVATLSQDKIVANQIMTIEPGIYIPNRWGMRIEDTVLINKEGRPEALTKFSNRLLII